RDRRGQPRRGPRPSRGPEGLSRRGRLMLEIRGVEAAYGLSRVLHGVTIEARQGEVVSLLGRNGAGKSTTLKAVVGLVDVTGGSVRLDGRDITALPPHEIAWLGVGWVPEDRRIFSDLTVAENLL